MRRVFSITASSRRSAFSADGICVDAGLRDELLMPALRRDLTILHHNDVVCPRDGGQPVSDHNYGFVFDELCHRALDHRFVFGINIGGRLVQNDDRRVFHIKLASCSALT